MPWIVMHRDYCWFPPEIGRAVHIEFKQGAVALVRRVAATEMTCKGAARMATQEEIENVRRRAA